MGTRKNYTVDEVLKQLYKKHDCKIIGNVIQVLNGEDPKHPRNNDLGNGSWGKIDFLKGQGYIQTFVKEFSHGSRN